MGKRPGAGGMTARAGHTKLPEDRWHPWGSYHFERFAGEKARLQKPGRWQDFGEKRREMAPSLVGIPWSPSPSRHPLQPEQVWAGLVRGPTPTTRARGRGSDPSAPPCMG